MTTAEAIEQIELMIEDLRFKLARTSERRGLSDDAKFAVQSQINTQIVALQSANGALKIVAKAALEAVRGEAFK